MNRWLNRLCAGLGLGVTLAVSLGFVATAATPDPLALYVGSLRPTAPYFATLSVDLPTGAAYLEALNTETGLYLRSPQAWPQMGQHGMMGLPAGSLFRRDEDTLVSPDLLAKNFVIRALDGETVLGRQTYRLELIPRWEGAIRRTVVIDRTTLVTLVLEDRDHEGTLVQRQEVIRLDLSPDIRRYSREVPSTGNGISDRYAGIEEAASLLGFRPVLPRYLPPGFSLYGVRLSPSHPDVAHLVFTDGVTVISLFERAVPWWARFGGGLARRSEHGYTLARGRLAHYLFGDVPPTELRRILQSI